VEAVVGCMPGAQVTERIDETTYNAKLTVAVGPIRPSFDVRATIDRDDDSKEGRIHVEAVDKRGGSRARARIVYRLASAGPSTDVQIEQSVDLSGPLAQFGRTGVIKDVNTRMTRQFAECLASRLQTAGQARDAAKPNEHPAQAADVRIIPLLLGSVWSRLKHVVGRRRGT
jgi:carbon monoxide dehydrogenase subunit G